MPNINIFVHMNFATCLFDNVEVMSCLADVLIVGYQENSWIRDIHKKNRIVLQTNGTLFQRHECVCKDLFGVYI